MVYKVDIAKNYCSCPHWKYQKRNVRLRECKHLLAAREHAGIYTTREASMKMGIPPSFMLISNTVPSHLPPCLSWSRKYDGIRVQWSCADGLMRTRNGMVLHHMISDGFIMTDNIRYNLDCELVYCDRTTPSETTPEAWPVSTHTKVMAAINTLDNTYLRLVVIDIMSDEMSDDDLPYVDRVAYINDNIVRTQKVSGIIVNLMPINSDADTLHMVCKRLQTELGFEGIIVNNINSTYIRKNKRDCKTVFKIK